MKKLLFILSVFCLLSNVVIANNKTKTDYRNALILAYSPVNSVYEDENIRLEIYNEMLFATNLTKKTIFIDLSQCFLMNNGSSYPMTSNKTDEKKASKHGVSTSIDEFLTIAPATGSKQNETFICNMSSRIYGTYTTTESPSGNFSEYETRMLNIINDLINESKKQDPKNKMYYGTAVRHLTEEESVGNIGASIAYAFNKRSEDWTTVTLSTWVSDIIFTPYYIEMPKEITKKEQQGFGIKESDPAKIHVKANTPFEFDEDKSPVIVCDWTGDYKKGKFYLYPTKISKEKKMNKLTAGLLTFVTGGATAALLFTPISETYYKNIICWDGSDSDWGKMNYTDGIMKTKQSH